MPELYSDSFLATVNQQAPDRISPPPGKQPNLPLLEQIQNAVGGEADMLAALAPSYKRLQVEFGDETDGTPTANNLNRFLVSPHKRNCNIAILYGNLNGNFVYVFLHEDNGTFPYKLTYHSFNPSTLAHVSEHACSYMYESIGTQGRHAAFEPAKDASQVGALALYYFSHLKRLACTYPLMKELTKQLQVMCRLIPNSQSHQASNPAQEREMRHAGTNKKNNVATQASEKLGPMTTAFSAPPQIQRGGRKGDSTNPQLKPTNIGMAAASPHPGDRPHQKRPAPAQLGPDLGRKKRRDQVDPENRDGGADLTRPDTGRTTERVHMHKTILLENAEIGDYVRTLRRRLHTEEDTMNFTGDNEAELKTNMERDTEVNRPPRAPASIEAFGARASSMAGNPQITSNPTTFPAQFQSRNPNSSYHAPVARASYPFLGARHTGGLTPGTSASRANNSFQARKHSSLLDLHTYAGRGLIDDLQAAHKQEQENTKTVQNIQCQRATALQDIAGMRNRYMELQAESARLMFAMAQAEHGLNLLQKQENDLNTVVAACRDRQRTIVDSMEPVVRGMIKLGRQMERENG